MNNKYSGRAVYCPESDVLRLYVDALHEELLEEGWMQIGSSYTYEISWSFEAEKTALLYSPIEILTLEERITQMSELLQRIDTLTSLIYDFHRKN